jgi:hypothetical protein
MSAVCLRYFNVVGCHHSGMLGRIPKDEILKESKKETIPSSSNVIIAPEGNDEDEDNDITINPYGIGIKNSLLG